MRAGYGLLQKDNTVCKTAREGLGFKADSCFFIFERLILIGRFKVYFTRYSELQPSHTLSKQSGTRTLNYQPINR